MSEELENSLDPTLELYYKINDQGLHVYFLSVYVVDKWIVQTSEQDELSLSGDESKTLSLWVSYKVRNHDLLLGDPKAHLEITCNPEGLPGEIVVLIGELEVLHLNDFYQPKADGKSIIRFEKAVQL